MYLKPWAMELNKSNNNYIQEIKHILAQARQKAYSAVNTAMVEAYWLIGKRIVEEEQNGKERAEYGKAILKTLSIELTLSLGKGFSERSLREFRQFYQAFPDLLITNKLENQEQSQNFWRTPFAVSVNPIWRSAFANLHWSHYQRILRVNNEDARTYYLQEAAQQNWSVRTLDRNIATLYYQRLVSSQKKEIVEQEMKENTAQFTGQTDEFIKNPTVLEFLNLPTSKAYTELELEQALIDNLQQFLLELGKGFSFVARQKHIRTETADFFIDLVFYNYILKCFVIVELKTNKLTHQDLGQLDMYVRMFDDLERPEGDNPTIGILLCTETDQTIAKYSVLNESKQLFANKYLPFLPTEEELITEIEREKLIIQQRLENEK
jgi:predicted nuclease of restriction endonuclease-like (RecB) superfamily